MSRLSLPAPLLEISRLRVSPACALSAVVALLGSPGVRAADDAVLRELQQQNELLREQLKAQQQQIQDLQTKVAAIAEGNETVSARFRELEAKPVNRSGPANLTVSGLGSLSFFSGESRGRYPNGEFMLDEARLFVEAKVLRNAYAFGELVLVNREALDENFHLGEFYIEFENGLGRLAPDRLVNFRAGRLFIPFGEEYLARNPIDNPLITHSVTDFWGVDEGLEVFGEYGDFNYAFAVQNGDISRLRDRTADKSLTLRVGWQATDALYLSASGYDSGRLDTKNELGSEMWIGNNVFRAFSETPLATYFQVSMGQLDTHYTWSSGKLKAAAGLGRVNDDDVMPKNDQNFVFYQIEGEQRLAGGLYAAARYSHLKFDRCYYLSGLGSLEQFFVLGTNRTRSMDRFTLGGGYRFSSDLNVKLEYSWEQNKMAFTGVTRPDEDQLAAQVAVRF